MSVYNLPEITNATIAPATASGEWTLIADLSALASDLRFDNRQLKSDALKSIPDAWAQAQLFGQALIDTAHEAHESVRSQWRGLLALFALQPTFDPQYTLSIAGVPLAQHDTANPRFRKVMSQLRPRRTLSRQAEWNDAGVVLFHPRTTSGAVKTGVPIALLSPICLLVAGRSADQVHHPDIPFCNSQGGFGDPLECSGLSVEQFAILGRFVSRIENQISVDQSLSSDQRLVDGIIRELGDFATACEARSAGALPLKEKNLTAQWPNPFYSILGRSFTIDKTSVPEGLSDCKLVIRRLDGPVKHLFKSIVLIDPALGKTLGQDASAVRVWETSSLADALRPDTLASIREDAAEKGHLVVTIDDLLTARLIKLSDGGLIRAHSPSTADHLLPLTPLCLLLGDATALAGACELADNGDGSEITLALEVETATGNVIRHLVRKTYRDDEIVAIPRPADLAVWPDFETPEWQWTFLRFQYDPRTDLHIRFGASAELVASDIRVRSTSAATKARAMAEWLSPSLAIDKRLRGDRLNEVKGADGSTIFQSFEFARTAGNIGEQHHLPLGVEAIFFAMPDERGPQPAGCALVKRTNPQFSGSTATIAIDFGSTNTIAYARSGGVTSQINFGSRVFRPIESRDNEGAKREELGGAYADFFPIGDHSTPFPTILKVRELSGNATGTFAPGSPGSDALGVRHMIFFRPKAGAAASTQGVVDLIQKGRLVSNIKWAKEVETRQQTQRFLRQTITMAAAELVARGISHNDLTWRFSYPQAFTGDDLQDFRGVTLQALQEFQGSQAAAPAFITEGEAAVRYFTEDSVAQLKQIDRLLIMLDIGGGTTDMAIWLNQKLVWRGSARIAGGKFFTDYLINNPHVLDSIDQSARVQVESGLGENADAPTQLIELLLSSASFASEFDKQYPFHSSERAWIGLRQSASVALGGMLYYIGVVLRGLLDDGKVDGLTERDLGAFTVAFGGRGSQFFRRLDATGKLQDLCKLVPFGAGLDGQSARVETRFSPQPKHEVARGLLTGTPEADRHELVSHYLPIGEPLETRGPQQLTLKASDDVTLLPSPTADLEDFELTGLKRFLEGLRLYGKMEIGLDGGSKGEGGAIGIIRGQTMSAVRNRRSSASTGLDTQAVEPPYLTALSFLVKLLAQSEKSRETNLAIRG